jgi:threonyl-tRNA synthetase
MKLLLIHASDFHYHVTERTTVAEEIDPSRKSHDFSECLVAYTAVEEEDEEDPRGVADQAIEALREVAGQLETTTVVLYPYAHLSASLASPQDAVAILKAIEADLGPGLTVWRAPFGWYKSFRIDCKGHPLSELSREIGPREEGEEIAEAAPVADEDFQMLAPDGSEIQPDKATDDVGGHDLVVLAKREALREEGEQIEEPEYLRLCRKFGVSWESMADAGHQRYGPKSALMFDLISDYAMQVVMDLGLPVFLIKGSNMFDLSHPAIARHADLYGDRLYTIRHRTERKEYVLRYAACFQQFSMVKDWTIGHSQLPFGTLEIADSYRLEQSGETSLNFRLRRFFMPDLHVFCRDLEEARHWFEVLHQRVYQEIRKLGRDYEILMNFSSRDEYDNNKEWARDLCAQVGKGALLHFYPPGKDFYWTINNEYILIDTLEKVREIATVQIDVGNAERFGITYIDTKGKPRHPVMLHSAVIGGIERFLYAIFDTALYQQSKGDVGTIPLWLNPEHVRIIPVAQRHLERAWELQRTISSHHIRVGIDDRDETVGKKIRQAKIDWVGYAIVIGDKEMSGDSLTVYDRESDANLPYSTGLLVDHIVTQLDNMPYRPLYMPVLLSQRPVMD